MTSTWSNILAVRWRSCIWAILWSMARRSSYTTNPSILTPGLSFQPFPFPSLEGPGNGSRFEAMSPAPSIPLPAASSRAVVPWWKVAAEEKRYSSIPSNTAEEFAVGRSWESKDLVKFKKRVLITYHYLNGF